MNKHYDPTLGGSFDPVGLLQPENGDPAIDASSVLALTTNKPADATKLLIQALDQDIRYTLDGTDPSASRGIRLFADSDPLIIPIGQNTTIKIIEEAATASISYQWGR